MTCRELARALGAYAETHGDGEVVVEYQTNEWYALDPGEPLYSHAMSRGETVALLNLARDPIS